MFRGKPTSAGLQHPPLKGTPKPHLISIFGMERRRSSARAQQAARTGRKIFEGFLRSSGPQRRKARRSVLGVCLWLRALAWLEHEMFRVHMDCSMKEYASGRKIKAQSQSSQASFTRLPCPGQVARGGQSLAIRRTFTFVECKE